MESKKSITKGVVLLDETVLFFETKQKKYHLTSVWIVERVGLALYEKGKAKAPF